MKPTRDDPHAVVDLLDTLLRDGAVIDADVVITVGDVPLVGISLRAAVAGMATMTEYGLLEEYDTTVRERATPDSRSWPSRVDDREGKADGVGSGGTTDGDAATSGSSSS